MLQSRREGRSDGWRTALLAVGFFVVWGLTSFVRDRVSEHAGFGEWYPPVAIDVLLLCLLGWRWWPLIPIAAVAQWWLFGLSHTVWPTLLTQSVIALGYAAGVWYLTERANVSFPVRTLRDVALFIGILSIGGPVVIGLVAVTLMVAIGHFSVASVPLQLSHFIIGDTTAITLIVPAVLAFVGWRTLRPVDERRDLGSFEAMLSFVATAALVVGGYALSTATHELLLTFTLIPIAWVALRFGMPGAIIAMVIADGVATIMHIALAMPANAIAQYETFLIASGLMALLLGALTTERWELQSKLAQRAYTDELTGLPNRESLIDWIERRRNEPVVLIMLDVDDMRLFNEGLGRLAADGALEQIAMRLRIGLPTSYFVARVSADEFAICLVDERSPHAIMNEIRAFFEQPFEIDGSRLFISVSLGAVRTVRTGSADELLRKADIALHRAKLSRTGSMVYSPDAGGGQAPSLVRELHRAVETGELVPFFQPIFRYDAQTQTWRVVGAEALMRWLHPERGVVSPVDFIGLLERLAVCEHAGWNIMRQSLVQAMAWRAILPEFRVWVNLFARQALDASCARRIGDALLAASAPGEALVVEINEGIVVSDERDIAALAQSLKDIGVGTAIDDFGTGGSSLGRIRDVPVDVLKIDRSFVTRIEVDSKAKAVASTVMRLAKELDMAVVAEGVENTMQLEVVTELGCEIAQGYALGHPLPAALFEQTHLHNNNAAHMRGVAVDRDG